jgi:MoaA/NifB/PqqE/SkfB family radical SAM enzyme
MTFFVTGRCNAVCPQCFYAGHNDPKCDTKELSLDEIEKFAKSLGNLPVLLLSGGEPTLRDDLPEIVTLFYRSARTRHVTLPTNGLLPERTERMVGRILESCPEIQFVVQLSADEIGERHDRLRGSEGAYSRMMDTFNRLRGLQAGSPNLGLAFCLTFSVYNQDRAQEILREIARTTSSANLRMVLTRGQCRDPGAAGWNIEKFELAVRTMFDIIAENEGRRTPGRSLLLARQCATEETIIRTVKEDRIQAPCLAGRVNVVIDEFGNVYPCELRWESMGSIRDTGYSLASIWNSDRTRELRRRIARSRCFCTHETNVITNISFVPSLWPRVGLRAIRFMMDSG